MRNGDECTSFVVEVDANAHLPEIQQVNEGSQELPVNAMHRKRPISRLHDGQNFDHSLQRVKLQARCRRGSAYPAFRELRGVFLDYMHGDMLIHDGDLELPLAHHGL